VRRAGGLEEAATLLGCGNRTGVEASPNAVSIVGDDAVAEVAQRARDDAQGGTNSGPGQRQLSQQSHNGVGAGEHALGGGVERLCDENGSGVAGGCGGVESKMRQQGGHFGRIRGYEAQAVELVVDQEPAHGSVA